jgi:hypothetical protein
MMDWFLPAVPVWFWAWLQWLMEFLASLGWW